MFIVEGHHKYLSCMDAYYTHRHPQNFDLEHYVDAENGHQNGIFPENLVE